MEINLGDVKRVVEENPDVFIGLKPHIVEDCLRRLPGNMPVLNAFKDHALMLKRQVGRQYYGIMCIQEKLRWDSYFMEEGEQYKLNNNHGPVYGRLIMALVPELSGMFRIKPGV